VRISLVAFKPAKRRICAHFADFTQNLPASQTRWRRGWDLNPRATFAAAGFQDRCLQPLGHPSALARPGKHNVSHDYSVRKVPRRLPVWQSAAKCRARSRSWYPRTGKELLFYRMP
jgi:hypothetical protein